MRKGLSLEYDGQSVPLAMVSRHAEFADGAGGLPTMKMAVVFSGKVRATAGAHQLSYLDNNFPGRAGWKEVVVISEMECRFWTAPLPAPIAARSRTDYSSDSLEQPATAGGRLWSASELCRLDGRGASATEAEAQPREFPPSHPSDAKISAKGTGGNRRPVTRCSRAKHTTKSFYGDDLHSE